MKEFNNKIDSIKRKNAKKQLYKTNNKDVSENTEALYNGLNIIVDAFQNQIFESKHFPEIDVGIDTTLDSNTYESHGLTKKELQMFKKRFNYKNSEELRQTLIETTDEKYNETLYNGLNIIVDAFENWIFQSKYCPEIGIDIDTTPDSNTYESHGLAKKELQMFKKRFSYKNPEELRQTLIESTDEKYNELLKALNIKLTVLKKQINTKTGINLIMHEIRKFSKCYWRYFRQCKMAW